MRRATAGAASRTNAWAAPLCYAITAVGEALSLRNAGVSFGTPTSRGHFGLHVNSPERASSGNPGNRLLARLSARDRLAVIARCTPVHLNFEDVLGEPGGRIRFVYFPLTCLISEMAVAEPGSALESGMIGNEGMLGATIVLGVDVAPLHALTRGAGVALRMSAAALRHELGSTPALRNILLQYCYVLLQQTAQTAACTHYHTLEARLARWLLMAQDRSQDGPLRLTHQFLAKMLGVRRVGVTHAAGHLQSLGLIHYHRGEVTIGDPIGLSAQACPCYPANLRYYDQVLASRSKE
jgi:CRP-like cAMP-binding protein